MNHDAVAYVIEPLRRTRNWIRFLAILMFVAGGMNLLSIVGLLVAPIPIAIGVLLWQAGSALGEDDPERLRAATSRLRQVFMVYSALAVLALVGVGLMIGLGFFAAVADAI